MFGNYRRLLFYALAAVALAGLIFLLGDQVLARRPFPSGTRVIVKTVYDLCGHEVVDREGLRRNWERRRPGSCVTSTPAVRAGRLRSRTGV